MKTPAPASPEIASIASALESEVSLRREAFERDGTIYIVGPDGQWLPFISETKALRVAMKFLKTSTFNANFSNARRRSRISVGTTYFVDSMREIFVSRPHIAPVAIAVIRARALASDIAVKQTDGRRRGAGANSRASYISGDCSRLLSYAAELGLLSR